MTVFAPIIPVGVESAIRSYGFVPNNVTLSPSVILQNQDMYKKLYSRNRPAQIFINSGMSEFDRNMGWNAVAEAARFVRATHIFLPDVLHDRDGTLGQATVAMVMLGKQPGFEVIGVPQGNSYEEYIDCANELVDMGVNALAVAKSIQDISRLRATFVLGMSGLGVPVHILGVSRDLDEDLYCCRLPRVKTISSALPIWLGQQGKTLGNPWVKNTEMYGSRPKDYFLSSEVKTEVLANLFLVASWLEHHDALNGVKPKPSVRKV
jgi:hypothetical protein